MKRVLILILPLVLLSMYNSELRAEEPKHSYSSLNDNINKFSWKLKSTKPKKLSNWPAELYTLEKNGYILKCLTTFDNAYVETTCQLP